MTLSPQGVKLLGAIRRNFELLVELEKDAPADVEQILTAMVNHLRAWKPMTLLATKETP